MKTTKVTAPDEVERARKEQEEWLRSHGLPQEWAATGDVFADQFIRIARDPVRFPKGNYGTYLRIENNNGANAGVIAIPKRGDKYLLVRHWRYATGRVHLEFPRGFVDAGENAEDAVLREIYEEIAAKPSSMKRLGSLYADTGLMNIPIDVFVLDVSATGPLEIQEGIEDIECWSQQELIALIGAGKFDDSLTLAAFLLELAS